jgi:hypothetical protein
VSWPFQSTAAGRHDERCTTTPLDARVDPEGTKSEFGLTGTEGLFPMETFQFNGKFELILF